MALKSDTSVGHAHANTPAPNRAARLAQPLTVGDVLQAKGLISARRLMQETERANHAAVRVADVLRNRLNLPANTLARAEAEAAKTTLVDPTREQIDRRLVHKLGVAVCLKHGLLPLRNTGGSTLVLTTRPDLFPRHRDALRVLFGPVRMAVTSEPLLHKAIKQACDMPLIRHAESRVPAAQSCRTWNRRAARNIGLAAVFALLAAALHWPAATFGLLSVWAVLTLVLNTALKATAGVMHLRAREPRETPANPTPARLPIVTILVPLFHEQDVARALIGRLSALDYPRELLDVCLILEEDDHMTRAAVARATLPPWIRPIMVPYGLLKTKPRALNYALNFARGTIIGVYDAEDAPAPDQIRKVVERFAQRGPQVACLQGVLDFYDYETNWLSRCFAVEYATWFRVMLPGLQRLGLAIPLGGTTLFMRRAVLEELGGWDAHNVTEDADLGIRLARHGYRTELIASVTEEEPNARVWPWVKQRSRWLKGYAITYGVHMRNPKKSWRELGAWRFFGVQLLFAGTLSQFTLAPVLWSFWLVALGLPHPLAGVLPTWAFWSLGGVFFMSELINIAVAMVAVKSARKPRLLKWTPTLHVYFPLAAIAAYKGVLELATQPFYWDKTEHGVLGGPDAAATLPPRPSRHPVSGG
ncbi:glycosyltransferase [Octadecabacter sp. SW4]|uniref:glycosyltransferase n=1 Tax=Octadecabacter sp. SW4 TaxID=2602067 RepID=UPI0020C790F4|nr:glycosyltransferase [Octadecabacter sp. SW4]